LRLDSLLWMLDNRVWHSVLSATLKCNTWGFFFPARV
jgi:hypothetical protein